MGSILGDQFEEITREALKNMGFKACLNTTNIADRYDLFSLDADTWKKIAEENTYFEYKLDYGCNPEHNHLYNSYVLYFPKTYSEKLIITFNKEDVAGKVVIDAHEEHYHDKKVVPVEYMSDIEVVIANAKTEIFEKEKEERRNRLQKIQDMWFDQLSTSSLVLYGQGTTATKTKYKKNYNKYVTI